MVDAEEAAARERDVPRRLLGEHRGGPPGSRAPQAALCAARSPLAPEPGLHRPAGPSVAAARGLSRRSRGLCAEAAILAGGGAEPARAGLSGRAGNGRAPGSEAPPRQRPRPPRKPAWARRPRPEPRPRNGGPARRPAPRALKRRTCGPAKDSSQARTGVHVPHVLLPHPHHRGRRKGAGGGPEQCGWPLSGPGRRHLSWTPGSGGPCCPGSIPPPSGVGLRPPGTPRSSPRARDLKDPPRLITESPVNTQAARKPQFPERTLASQTRTRPPGRAPTAPQPPLPGH